MADAESVDTDCILSSRNGMGLSLTVGQGQENSHQGMGWDCHWQLDKDKKTVIKEWDGTVTGSWTRTRKQSSRNGMGLSLTVGQGQENSQSYESTTTTKI